jgi:hypothetical protein
MHFSMFFTHFHAKKCEKEKEITINKNACASQEKFSLISYSDVDQDISSVMKLLFTSIYCLLGNLNI